MRDRDEDFNREITTLREGRPTLTPLELDRVRSRARRGAEAGSRHGWQGFARTRGAVVAVLAAGTLMTTGGSALAVSGLGLDGAASTAQYGGPATDTTPATTDTTNPPTDNQGNPPSGPAQAVSPAEQAQQPGVSAAGRLPLTGFMAIPVLLIGLVLIAVGVAGRRVARRSTHLPPG